MNGYIFHEEIELLAIISRKPGSAYELGSLGSAWASVFFSFPGLSELNGNLRINYDESRRPPAQVTETRQFL